MILLPIGWILVSIILSFFGMRGWSIGALLIGLMSFYLVIEIEKAPLNGNDGS